MQQIQDKNTELFDSHKQHINAVNQLNALHAERQQGYIDKIDGLNV